MPGDQELHALAEYQLIAHGFAVAVTGIHQGLQQVLARRLIAALLDVLHQNVVSARPHLLVFAEFARDGKPRIQIRLNGLTNNKFLDGADGMADEIDIFILQPGAKQ